MPASLVLGALQHVWRSLEPFKLPMALMGGLALATWQHLRATRDIDILISLGSTNTLSGQSASLQLGELLVGTPDSWRGNLQAIHFLGSPGAPPLMIGAISK
jgi:hypothetical protein